MTNFINRKNIIIAAGAVVVIGTIFLTYILTKPVNLSEKSVEVKLGDVTKEISLTGQVESALGVDLAFERSGKVIASNINVGDSVYQGQALVVLDSSDLSAQLSQAQAQLAGINIDNVIAQNNAGLESAYSDGLSAAQKSVTIARNSLIAITDIQYSQFFNYDQTGTIISQEKSKAVKLLLGADNGGLLDTNTLSQLSGGAFGSVQNAVSNPSHENIDKALSDTLLALQETKNAVDIIPVTNLLTSVQTASLAAEKSNIAVEIIAISGKIEAISVKKAANDSSLSSAQAQIQAAQAAIKNIQAQIAKTVLRAPFSGTVAKKDVQVGEIVSPSAPLVTIIGGNLQIQTEIPEIDIAGIKNGDSAKVTLDAYGSGVAFDAKVISIDLAKTLINGVSVYNAKLQFSSNDERIKTGMTANIIISSSTKTSIIVIPQNAMIENMDKYFVYIDRGNGVKEQKEITIGVKGSNGNVEVLSGLSIGEKVFTY